MLKKNPCECYFFLTLLWCCVFEYLSSKPLGIASKFSVSMHAQSLSRVWLFVTPWTAACQAPLPMQFSRQGYWSRLPFPTLGDVPDPGIKLASPALAGDSLPLHHLGSPSKLQTNKNPRRQRTMRILEEQTRKMSYVPKETEPQRHPVCVCSVTQLYPTLWDPVDGSPPDSSVPGIYTWREY